MGMIVCMELKIIHMHTLFTWWEIHGSIHLLLITLITVFNHQKQANNVSIFAQSFVPLVLIWINGKFAVRK